MNNTPHNNVTPIRPEPRILSRQEHNISRDNISESALKVLYRLKNAGFEAYLVGGSVRDLLLGREPKDFDVVTSATPEQVRELFRNSRVIGRRFKLVHVRFNNEIIEVSTFRTAHHIADGEGHVVDGTIIRDNVYGTIDDDVWRRDLSVNALFYNIKDFSVIDYVGGLDDIRAGRIRLIGDPEKRYIEDPVRLLRVVRFATKLGFRIDKPTEEALTRHTDLLDKIPPARLFEETLKLFLGGCALQTFEQLRHYGLFSALFPQTEEALSREEGGFPHMLLIRALENTDKRLGADMSVTPGFLLAAMLWAPMQEVYRDNLAKGMSDKEAMFLAGDIVISRQIANLAIPRRFTKMAREIWQFQSRLTRTRGKQPARTMANPRFRAAYDFLLLRAQAGENVSQLVDFWTGLQNGEHGETIKEGKPSMPRNRRKRRPRTHRS